QFQDVVPVGVADGVDGLGDVGAGVVDEDIDPAELFQGGAGQAVGLAAAAEVGDDAGAAAAGAGQDLREGGPQLVLVPAGDDDVGPGLGQAAGHRLAEALAAPGDQGHFPR